MLVDAILIVLLTFGFEVDSGTEHVSFTKEDCGEYRHYYLKSESDVYIVDWDGQEYPRLCDLHFFDISSGKYRLCAEVTEFTLDCHVKLQFIKGSDIKEYGCYDNLPIQYCDDDGVVFISLLTNYHDIRTTHSSLHIRVSASHISSVDKEDGGSSFTRDAIIAAVVAGVFLTIMFVSIGLCYYKRRRHNWTTRTASNAQYNRATVHRQNGTVQVILTNTNQQGQYQPVPMHPSQLGQQNQHIGQPSAPSSFIGHQYQTMGQPQPQGGQQYQSSGQPLTQSGQLYQQHIEPVDGQNTQNPPPSYSEEIGKR